MPKVKKSKKGNKKFQQPKVAKEKKEKGATKVVLGMKVPVTPPTPDAPFDPNKLIADILEKNKT